MSGKSVCNRCIQASTSPDGQVGHAQLSSPSLRESVDIYASDRPVIPVVFLPGVMGSNLYNTKTKEVVWAPGGPLSTLWKYGITFDSSRQERLDVTGTELYLNGEITAELTADYWNDLEPGVFPPGLFESEAALRVRGWGGVFGSSYHAFMSRLQREMNAVMLKGAITPLWQKLLALPLQNYGVKMCCASLTGDDLKNVAPFRFEVWGGGYNWLEGNAESARKIQQFIETTVLPHYKKNLATNKQVILVTHSMGGLVARSLCVQTPKLVLGVLHGAMPANGAAESYTNMRQGVQGTMGIVLGSDSASVGAVFTQCQGGLELLPFGGGVYNRASAHARISPPRCLEKTNPGEWLFMQQPQGELLSCSSAVDVYERIYKSEQWYGLLPRQNEHHFDPANILRKEFPKKTLRVIFEKIIDAVKIFHDTIRGKYHPETYAFWSSAKDTAAVGEAVWTWSRSTTLDAEGAVIDDYAGFPRDTGKGSYTYKYDNYKLCTVFQTGDGTVPRASWEADLCHRKIKGYACLGTSKNDPKGFGHQQAFNDHRASDISLYFLAKMVSDNKEKLKV